MTDDNWWRGSVTYQVYPRSFMDSDGDGVGDIKGITQKLDHIASLGVDAVWLSPVFTSPMLDMGYDVSDYTDIDPVYGTLSDFDDMVARAHELGLKVIVDQVISHASDQHPFFQNSRMSRDSDKSDWFIWADPKSDGTPPTNWMSLFGGVAWEWEPRRRQYYFHNFAKGQPDWNFWNPEVQDYMLGVMKFWLDRGVDGFRLDTVNYYFHDKKLRDNPADYVNHEHPPHKPYDYQYQLFSKSQPENVAWLERIRALLDQYDARTTVGEVGDNHKAIELMGEYTTGKRLHMAYSFDMLGPDFSPKHFRGTINRFFHGAPDGWPCWAFSNHDVPRHTTRFLDHGPDSEAVSIVSAALLLSFRGSVCLYQGEELGQIETEMLYEELTDVQGLAYWPDEKGRDGCRTPMVWEQGAPFGGFSTVKPWLPVKEPQLARAVDTETAQRVMQFYREMIKVRATTPALKTGTMTFLDMPDPVLTFTRDDDVICAFNLSKGTVAIDLPCPCDTLISRSASVDKTHVTLGPSGFLVAQKI
ncbi:Oligo-1,6-glucosidase [Aquimixticola soesokkakensis]|uniref:Oligo-1,6-glucosidase n=1 Tax=Aquimixticola soesokkakensis TaxID=1519096 RepID=A0A1Y5SXW0_9RHOB|nr:alpha-glucosidase [Aquimixticola soesokkakensis]SLN51250.1 Oligo-1,6-glucosidase [Aquimixticola soesokkakensis]